MLFPFYDRTRKILWNGIRAANKERCGKPPPSLQMWYPQTQREVSDDGIGCRIQIQIKTQVVRGKMWIRRGVSGSFLGRKSAPPTWSWISSFFASLKDSQDFQKLHVFSHGCFFLTFSTPAMLLIQMVYLQWTDTTIPLPWVNTQVPRPTENLGNRAEADEHQATLN